MWRYELPVYGKGINKFKNHLVITTKGGTSFLNGSFHKCLKTYVATVLFPSYKKINAAKTINFLYSIANALFCIFDAHITRNTTTEPIGDT